MPFYFEILYRLVLEFIDCGGREDFEHFSQRIGLTDKGLNYNNVQSSM